MWRLVERRLKRSQTEGLPVDRGELSTVEHMSAIRDGVNRHNLLTEKEPL